MSSPPSTDLTTALDALAEPRRRYLLATLLEHGAVSRPERSSSPDELTIETLATEVAAVECGCPIVTDEQCDRVHIVLVHAHVPRLVDAGLVTRRADGDETIVALADHPVLEAEWVRSLLDDPTGDAFPADEATLDRTLEVLRAPRRRTVCAALARRRGTVAVADLAAAVVALEGDEETRLVDVTETACADAVTSLVHEHLPALSDAGLVAYDEAAKRVSLATDAPQWRADWVTEGPLAPVADLVRHPVRQEREADATGGSAEAATETSAADDAATDESIADLSSNETATTGDQPTTGDRLLWTLARPRAERSTADRSVEEVTNQ